LAKKRLSRISTPAEETTTLVGLSCSDNDYRVCWDLNNLLGLKLSRIDNLVVARLKGKNNEFGLYNYNDEGNSLRYYLIPNKGSNGLISESYKKIDFFIIICGTISAAKTEKIITSLKNSQIISAAFLLPAQIVKALILPY
jgi:hypothetical protein